MPQYDNITDIASTVVKLSDGIGTYRFQPRGGTLWIDKEISSIGFDGGIENVDWKSVFAFSSVASSIDNFRIGARDYYWRVDQALTEDAYLGGPLEWDDDTNWDDDGFFGDATWLSLAKYKLKESPGWPDDGFWDDDGIWPA